jgi:hypothetical protein
MSSDIEPASDVRPRDMTQSSRRGRLRAEIAINQTRIPRITRTWRTGPQCCPRSNPRGFELSVIHCLLGRDPNARRDPDTRRDRGSAELLDCPD